MVLFYRGAAFRQNTVNTSRVPGKVSKKTSTDRSQINLNPKLVGQYLDSSRVCLNKDKEGHYDVLGELLF